MKVEIMQIKRISQCPNLIFDPSHYTEKSCLCFDKKAKKIKGLGYKWSEIKGHWD